MTQELITRLEKLERQNRTLKLIGGAAITLGLASFVGPRVCDTVWAERFVLRDSSNKIRMTMDAYRTGNPTVTFHDSKGREQASLVVHKDGQTMDFTHFGQKTTWSSKAESKSKGSCQSSGDSTIE